MEEATGGKPPANDGYTFGWIWSYPTKAVLEQAVENGDLTRAGVRKAVDQVTVDYEGALPDRKYAASQRDRRAGGDDRQARQEGPARGLGLKDLFVGPTAKGYDFRSPARRRRRTRPRMGRPPSGRPSPSGSKHRQEANGV